MESVAQIFDVSLMATVALIFFLALLGANIRSRRRDVCLRAFHDYPVTVERAGGRVIWGIMELESTGLELHYLDSVQDQQHIESSYVMYGSEFADIQAIYRYVDELSDGDKKRRERQLMRYFHPGPLVRLWRGMQHFFALASDSLTEVLGMIMGSLRKPAGRYITDASEAHLKQFSSTIVGSMGSTFDPLMERLIGQKVVFELMEGDEVHEHVGIFKNYSADFMEFLDVQYPQQKSVNLDPSRPVAAKGLSAVYENGTIRMANHTQNPLLVRSMQVDDEEELLNVVVDGGELIELYPKAEFSVAKLTVNVVRTLDMIVPRSRCVVRHRAERYEPEMLPEIIFDIGVLLRGNSLIDAREERLRKQLQEFPGSALAASNLGSILIQKKQYAEARKWLEQAYRARFSLPDNGRRTLMLLHELERGMAKNGERRPDEITPAVAPGVADMSASRPTPKIMVESSEGTAGVTAMM